MGVYIKNQQISVKGRVLLPPELKFGPYYDYSREMPANGHWNYYEKGLVLPVEIKNWAVVDFSSACNSDKLVEQLIECAKNKQIHMAKPFLSVKEHDQSKSLSPEVRVELIFQQIKQLKPNFSHGTVGMKHEELQQRLPFDFIFCVLEKNSGVYGPWKRKCMTEAGVVTQCISAETIQMTADQYLTNVVLKMNMKLECLNFLISNDDPHINNTPTLILGMSVSRGSPKADQSDIPAIAAVVGSSYWPYFSRYGSSVRTQSSNEEMIKYLYDVSPEGEDEGMIRELLVDFYQKSVKEGAHCMPERIDRFCMRFLKGSISRQRECHSVKRQAVIQFGLYIIYFPADE